MGAEVAPASRRLPDGLTALQHELSLGQVMTLIERTARWVDKATFELLPVWFPESARGDLRYKANWSEPLLVSKHGVREHRRETNEAANLALTLASGLRPTDRTNWSCCHIWSLDDPSFQTSNAIARDHRYYSCVANMVLLPTPLKAFTDTMPLVKTMLRLCAKAYYGWACDHEHLGTALDEFDNWEAYPQSWPRAPGEILAGVMPINAAIRLHAQRRIERIKWDLCFAGAHYPRDAVRAACLYWNIPL